MTTLVEAKQEIADALNAAGIKAYAHDVKTVGNDFIVVEPGSPFLEKGETFHDNTIRFDLAVIGKPVTQGNVWSELDNLINEVVLALWDVADLETVSQPGIITMGNKANVAATVTVTASINLKETI